MNSRLIGTENGGGADYGSGVGSRAWESNEEKVGTTISEQH